MKLEKRTVWSVGRWFIKGKSKEFNILSAFSTKKEAEDKLNWYKNTYTKGIEVYEVQEIETWFPSEF